jgi:hypothetical protein
MTPDPGAAAGGIPRTTAELADLEASYQPFHSAGAWLDVHVDAPRWNRYAHLLARQVQAAGESAWKEAQDRLLRLTALDSAALGGLFPANPELTTLVLADSVAGLDPDDMADPIDLVVECHRRALVLASEAADARREVDVNLIAVLQDVITEAQATYTVTTDQGENVEVDLPRRQYKPVSNYLLLPGGTVTAFAPAAMVPQEMARLAGELASPAFAALHPAVQAAYVHYALTAIHPFADGNGRLARTIASIFLLRSVGVPLLIFADQWPPYYQALGYHALGAAHRPGDRQLLADYVSITAMSAMDLATHLLARPAQLPLRPISPTPDATSDEVPRAELEGAALELLDVLCAEVRQALVSPPRGVRIAISATRGMPAGHREPAYRPATSQALDRCGVRVAMRAAAGPAPVVTVDLDFVALVSEIPGDLFPVALRETRSNELLEVSLSDAYPLISESTTLRAGLWAQRLLAQAMTPILAAQPPAAAAAPSGPADSEQP